MQTTPQVTLLKTRSRHQRWFGLAALLAYALSTPVLPHDSVAARLLAVAGYLLVLAGAGIRVYAALFIGGWKNARLASGGPYSVVRNPLYVGSLIAAAGVGLLTGTATLALGMPVVLAYYYDRTVRREEAWLEREFGEPYREYLRSVPRWIPDLSRWSLPEQVNARPRYVWKGLRDVLPILLVWPAVECVRLAHAGGLLPALYRMF
ncbi:MAG: isoprenylcysteine carboxylmethyltransferase family protein [Gammaproteobacteria bacterium]